jgi:hypothetical protein
MEAVLTESTFAMEDAKRASDGSQASKKSSKRKSS